MSAETAYRSATRDDCREIAELYRLSSDGVADYVWSTMEEPGLTLLEVGERRYIRENTAFSYQNCVIAEDAGAVMGMMHCYVMDERAAGDAEEESDPVLRPYAELEAVGSLYISGVAVFPEFRGRGLGTELLSIAGAKAQALDLAALSLLVFEQNSGALKLYERRGFSVIERRRVVPHALIHRTGDILLMTAPV